MNKLLPIGLCISTLLTACGPHNTFQAPPPPAVTIQHPEQKTVTIYKDFTGELVAKDTADIRARVQGFLKTVDFTPRHTRVKEGDILFTIEAAPYEATVASMKAKKEKAEANLKLKTSTLQRQRDLYANKAISELELFTAEAEEAAAKASVDEATAAIESAELDLSYTKVIAPFSGKASRNYISVGNLVGAGQPTLLTTLVSDDPMYAYFKINERDLLTLADTTNKERKPTKDLDLKVYLQLANGKQYEQPGKLDYVDNRIDPDTGMIEVRAVFPNDGRVLIPGLFARVQFPNELESAILIPDYAIQKDLGGSYVLIVDDNNTVDQQYIETGELVETMRIVTKGLDASDRVIIKGLQRARTGIQVTPQEQGKES